MKEKLKKLIHNPYVVFSVLAQRRCMDWVKDETYLKLKFRAAMGRALNLETPRTYNEKLQWLKLYNRRPEYTMMVDKYEVRKFVAEKLGEEYLIPLLGVWDDPDEIDFDALPDRFVLKCNHNSGLGMYICRDKSAMDVNQVKEELRKGLKQDYYLTNREWPYKNVRRRIVAEAYMEDRKTAELRDYKFFCFNGEPKALFIATDRQTADEETKFDFFDMDYQHLDIRNGHPNAKQLPEKPECFDKMREMAAKLAENIPHVRVDFYEVDGKIYFGEMTFFHWSGMVQFEPVKWDDIFGSWIILPEHPVTGA